MYKWVILHQDGDLRGYGDGPKPNHFNGAWPWPEGAEDVRDLELVEEAHPEIHDETIKYVRINLDQKAMREIQDADKALEEAAQKARETKISLQESRRSYGAKAVAYISALSNDQDPTPSQDLEVLTNDDLALIEKILLRGGVTQAIPLVTSLTLPSFWTEQMRSDILDFLNEYSE